MTSTEFDLEEDLQCAVCLGVLDDPKVLPCSHVFCRRCMQLCMQVRRDKTVMCGECRTVHQVPGGEAKNLTTDLRIKNLVEKYLASGRRFVFRENAETMTGNTSHAAQVQTLSRLEENWATFRKKNAEQRKESDTCITQLINFLQQKKGEVLKVYDDYDQHAGDRITNIQQLKRITDSVQEIRSQLDAAMSEVIPDTLGVVLGVKVEREIRHFASPITRRQAGMDADIDLVYSESGNVREYEELSTFAKSKISAEGKLEIHRHRGGLYQLQVVDKNDKSKILKKFDWNNRAQSDEKPTMATVMWQQVPWVLSTGGRRVLYSTGVGDNDRRRAFEYAMLHAHRQDV